MKAKYYRDLYKGHDWLIGPAVIAMSVMFLVALLTTSTTGMSDTYLNTIAAFALILGMYFACEILDTITFVDMIVCDTIETDRWIDSMSEPKSKQTLIID